MKTIILYTLLVTICLFLGVQGNCYFEGKNLTANERTTINCIEYTCQENGNIFAKTCAESLCPGKQLGYQKPDLNKSYPECCPRPICEKPANMNSDY